MNLVQNAKADIVYISAYDNASVPLVQQMRQLKVRAMDVHHTMLTGSLARQVGADIDGMTGELSWYPGIKGAYSDLVETVMKRSDVTMFDYIWTLGRLTSLKPASANTWTAPTCSSPQVISRPG